MGMTFEPRPVILTTEREKRFDLNLIFSAAQYEKRPLDDVFTFTSGSLPLPISLAFHPKKKNTSVLKRARALSDIDGEYSCNTCKKKRRLRLHLITSRLSRPFSAPPTHIADRGSSKVAVWAKRNTITRGFLRKVAILNRVRKTIETAQASRLLDQKRMEMELNHLVSLYGLYDTFSRKPGSAASRAIEIRAMDAMVRKTTPTVIREHTPLPPSPLGLSNYDILDEEDFPDHRCIDADWDDENETVYSDWSVFGEPSECAIDDDDEDEYIDVFSANLLPEANGKKKKKKDGGLQSWCD